MPTRAEPDDFLEWEGMVTKLADLKAARKADPENQRLRDQLRLHKMLMEQERDYWRGIGQYTGSRKFLVGGDAVLVEGS